MKLSLFLIGALAAVSQRANAAIMDAEEASEKRQQDEYERNLEGGLEFTQTYSVVTTNKNIIFVTPSPLLQFASNAAPSDNLNGRSSLNLLGSKINTFGLVLKPTTVVLIQTDTEDLDAFELFAGGLQPQDDNPSGNSNFFLAGSCTTISQLDDERAQNDDIFNPTGLKFLPTIQSHQCIYDLCLGGRGFNCLSLYGGGGFIFNPVNRISIGLVTTNDDGVDQSIVTDNNREPPLPPAFELVVFGGTGSFRLVSGKADLITVAGRTRGNPLNGVPQKGVIVQNLITYTNIPLPEAKN